METINLSKLEDTWESINLFATVVIYRHYSGVYHIMVVFMNESTRQAQPSLFEIYKEEDGYYFGLGVNRQRLEYDRQSDLLILSKYGRYQRS